MKGRIKFLLHILWTALLLPLSGCEKGLNTKDYANWIKDTDNGLRAKKKVNHHTFDLQYLPAEYVWWQRNKMTADKEKMQDEVRAIEELQYYTLTLGIENDLVDFVDYGVQDLTEKQQKLYYFSYGFQQDLKLEVNGRLLPCVLFHFERTLDLKSTRTFVLGFENDGKDTGETRLIIESGWISTIPVKIKISKKNIPKLRL